MIFALGGTGGVGASSATVVTGFTGAANLIPVFAARKRRSPDHHNVKHSRDRR